MNMEESIRFYDWMETKRIMPTAEDVMKHFDCSRATAYRRLDDFRRARGIYQERSGPYGIDRYVPVALPAKNRPVPAWMHPWRGVHA